MRGTMQGQVERQLEALLEHRRRVGGDTPSISWPLRSPDVCIYSHVANVTGIVFILTPPLPTPFCY